MDKGRTHLHKIFQKPISTLNYLAASVTLAAIIGMTAIGYSFLPEAEVSAQIADTKAGAELETPEVATQAMIDFALNMKSASEYTVYAEKGITDRGTSEIRGTKGDAMRSAAGRKSTKELANTIDALKQLPCTDPAPFGMDPLVTTATVSMLPRAGAYLEGFDILPAERRNGPDVKGAIVGVDAMGADIVIPAPGGGYVDVVYPASTSAVSETLVVSRARSNPARLKICKIAGPGIPINTLFRFTVSGFGALTTTHPQAAEYGTVTRTFDVRAGDPAQGGRCEFVPGIGANPPGYDQFQTFVNGTPVTITEHGLSPDNTEAQNPGQLRVSQVRVFGSAFTNTAIAGFSPNPDTNANDAYVARASVVSRASIVEMEFSGFRFNPTVLKVCSIGDSTTIGAEFQYTVSLASPQIGGANPGPMFPAFSTTLTGTAGPVGSGEGNCTFVNGSGLSGGAFNQGSTVTVTQAGGGPSVRVTGISCPTCGPSGLSSDLVTRRATLSGTDGLKAGINAVIYSTTRVDFPPCPAADRASDANLIPSTSCRAERFDFDGDHKADPAVYSPTQGLFSYASSVNNYQIFSRPFGVAGDRPVPADYDGDGKVDYAVWRPSVGRWYIQASTGFFEVVNWGEPGDIPQPGDYDGDGRVDFILFRPSNATWYVRTRTSNFHIFQFGLSTDRPIAAEYDGDGRIDAAVFRNGTWYTLESGTGFRVTQFGQASDLPLRGDFDGDGRTDFAVFRPSNATWYVRNSIGYSVRQFGTSTDVPVPADYDGDGKTDMAVWRPSEGRWYIRRSAVGESDVYVPPIILGQPTDIPLQAPDVLFGGPFLTVIF